MQLHKKTITLVPPIIILYPPENKPSPSLTPNFLQRYVYLDNTPHPPSTRVIEAPPTAINQRLIAQQDKSASQFQSWPLMIQANSLPRCFQCRLSANRHTHQVAVISSNHDGGILAAILAEKSLLTYSGSSSCCVASDTVNVQCIAGLYENV